MNAVFEEIEKLRDGAYMHRIESLSNRHVILCQNSDGTKSAYYFSVPIRNYKTNNIVDLRFYHTKQGSTFIGSHAKIMISDRISFINEHGTCNILFESNILKKTEDAVYLKDENCNVKIRPTLNGLILIIDCDFTKTRPKFTLCVDRKFESIRKNEKYFSIMREKFLPFITVSCIGAMNDQEKIIAPCEVYSQKLNDLTYDLTFCATRENLNRIAIEINMQEVKLFQDTTVESRCPKLNNVFGGISFLGTSEEFGEQWLYSRLETSNIPQLQNKRIQKTVLHIPQLGDTITPLTIHQLTSRFCSFGSNWENKIAITDQISESTASYGYYHLNLTKVFGNFRRKSENFVIRAKSTSRSLIIPTGDSFYTPQIFEVKFH